MTNTPDSRELLASRIIGVLLGLLTLFCGVMALKISLIGWDNPILGMHGPRQTQTAISSYYLQHGSGGLFHYETPLFGYPWEIPFEFPLYQYFVAVVSTMLHVPLDQTGRGVSEFFWAATLLLLWPLLGELNVRPLYRPVFFILLLVSPEYLFWSRAFVIESTALCFCVAYLLFVLRYLRLRHPRELVAGVVFGVLAALVKITTLPAFLALGFCAYAVALHRALEPPRAPATLLRAILREALPLLLLFLIPIAAGVAWSSYANSIRANNPLTNPFLLNSALTEFMFGTLSQRLDRATWDIFLNERVRDAVGSIRMPLLALLCFAVVRLRWKESLLALIAYLIPLLVFTNLYFVHNYYAYANSLFMAGFVGFGVLALLEKRNYLLQGAALIVLVYAVFVSLSRYELEYRKEQEFRDTELPTVSQAVRARTAPDEVVVIAGMGWSPGVPYYSERRAILFAEWVMDASPEKMATLMDAALRNLGPRKVGAVAICQDARTNRAVLDALQIRFGLPPKPDFQNDMCSIYDLNPDNSAASPSR